MPLFLLFWLIKWYKHHISRDKIYMYIHTTIYTFIYYTFFNSLFMKRIKIIQWNKQFKLGICIYINIWINQNHSLILLRCSRSGLYNLEFFLMSTILPGGLFHCLTDNRKEVISGWLQIERNVKNVLVLPLLKVWDKGVWCISFLILIFPCATCWNMANEERFFYLE